MIKLTESNLPRLYKCLQKSIKKNHNIDIKLTEANQLLAEVFGLQSIEELKKYIKEENSTIQEKKTLNHLSIKNTKPTNQEIVNDLFFQSCLKGDLKEVKKLLTSKQLPINAEIRSVPSSGRLGPNYDNTYGYGLTMAFTHGSIELVDYLLSSPELKEHASLSDMNGTTYLSLDGEDVIFQEYITDIGDDFSNQEVCVVYNYDEAASEDFFTYLSREYKGMLELTKTEGLFDSECIFEEEYAGNDD